MKARRLEVITLYRQCLRSAQRCPSYDQQEFLRIYVRRKFKESTTIRDASLIAHLLKEGVSELKTMESFHAARASKDGHIAPIKGDTLVVNEEKLQHTSDSLQNVSNTKDESNVNRVDLGDSQENMNNKKQIDLMMKRKLDAEMRLADALARKAEADARKAEAEAALAESDAELVEAEALRKEKENFTKKR